MRNLLESGLAHDTLTVTGETLSEAVQDTNEAPGQDVLLPVAKPVKPTGGLGNPLREPGAEGCVINWLVNIGKPRRSCPGLRLGRAGVIRWAGEVQAGDVVVIRYEARAGRGIRNARRHCGTDWSGAGETWLF